MHEGRTTTHNIILLPVSKNDRLLHYIKALLHKRGKNGQNWKITKIDKIIKSDKSDKIENVKIIKSDKTKKCKNVSKCENGQKRGGMSLKGVNVTLRVFRAIWWGHFCQTAWTPVFCVFGLRMGFHDF